MSYTYVTMSVSREAYEEIREILLEAGYDQALHEGGIIDLHGLALSPPIKQASEIMRDMVPEADRPRFDIDCERELRQIKREAWWYRWCLPYRWYINWGWQR